jgi:hypothetical protein
MENETGAQTPGRQTSPLHSLIPLADFKALLGIDAREDSLSRYCLATATWSIEHYCKRRLLQRRNTDYFSFTGDYRVTLREYPVGKILNLHAVKAGTAPPGQALMDPENLIADTHYYCVPDEGSREDIPFSLVIGQSGLARFAQGLPPGARTIRVHYLAGYSPKEAGDTFGVPPDLASACLELAAWNLTRLKGRRIGITGNIRGSGKEGEHLETSMPENVRFLLEPYRRRTI